MNAKKSRSYKRSIILSFILLLFFQILFGGVFFNNPVYAETLPPPLPTKSPTPTFKPTSTPRPTTGPQPTRFPTLSNFNTYVDTAKLYLSQLDYAELILSFPDTKTVFVRLPDQWQLKATSSFTLHYTLYDQNTGQPTPVSGTGYRPPSVKLYVNNYLASTFTPQSGKDQYYTFELPLQVVDRIDNNPENGYTFTFEYVDDHEFYCGYTGILKIHEDSSFNVNFNFMSPQLDLSRFPSPISQNSSIPETIYFIVPDNYNGSDLSAAATTAAMINKVNESIATYKIVKESDRMGIPDKANVVIIGTPSRNTFLRDVLYRPTGNAVGMPSSLGAGNKIYINSASRFLADDEGLIQLMQSIRNPRYSYMIVTGNTDFGLERAALGLSSPPIGQVGAGYIVGSKFKLPDYQLNNVVTLKSLGFKNTTLYGFGTNIYAIPFYVPRNWKMEEGTSFVLRYRNSDNLDETNSSLAVYVNDQPAGSVKIDIKNAGEKEVTIPINIKDIRAGWLNELRIEATSDMVKACVFNPRAFLINVQETSMLNLPHSLITDQKELSPITQAIYYMGTKPSVYVSMPGSPTKDDLDMLMSFASLFGSLKLPTVDFHVGLATDDLTTKSGYNLLVIGRPSTNPQIEKINKYIPQKFVSNSDTLEQMVGNVSYQVPPGVSLGVMEAITSPFDPEMGLTLISGTNQEGQKFLYNRLVQSPLNITELEGDLVFVGNKTTRAFQTWEGSQISLDIASSSVTGTKVALQVVPTPGVNAAGTDGSQAVKYVSNVSVTNPISQMIGKYLLVGLLVAGAFILVLAITRTARGGRRG